MDYLIKLVRNNPCIYDTNNELYKNTAYKNKVWEKIGEDMQENSKSNSCDNNIIYNQYNIYILNLQAIR